MKKLYNIAAFCLSVPVIILVDSCAKLNQVSPTGVQSAQLFREGFNRSF